MKWRVERNVQNGWYSAIGVRHFTVDVPRLYAIFDDPASWPQAEPRRRTLVDKNERLGYAFDNDTRAEIRFESPKSGLSRVVIRAEMLHTRQEAKWASNYWADVLDSVSQRTGSEQIVGFTAPGKLNLFFKVGALRPDGYHDVASVYQAVELRESVIVEHAPTWHVSVVGNLSPIQLAGVPTGEENLVVKAAKLLAEAAGKTNYTPVEFFIEKVVPVAGGMGGGSADAAAAIASINKLWNLNLSTEQLLEVAAKLGADVPFALKGGLAVGLGAGEQLKVVKQPGEYHWALVTDELGLSTPAVYRKLDELRESAGLDIGAIEAPEIPIALQNALKSGAPAEDIAALLHNDLEAAAISLRPDLKQTLDLVEEVGALRAIVSGSGPTIAFLGRDSHDVQLIASKLRTRGKTVIVTNSPAAGTEALQ